MIAYVHISKTAGTTFTGILRRNFAARHFDTRLIQEQPAITAGQLQRALRLYPRVESIAGHAVRHYTDLKAGFPDMRFYTFLREPRRRFVSAFLFGGQHRIRRENWRPESDREIEEAFLARIHRGASKTIEDLVPDGGGAEAAIEAIETHFDFVGLVEHFDECLALFRNWVGDPNFDPRYRRLNVSEAGRAPQKRYAPVQSHVDRLISAVEAFAARPDIQTLLTEALADEIALFEHVRTKTLPLLRRAYSAGDGPFRFEDPAISADTVSGRLYRNLVGRPFVHLLARPAPNAVR